MTVIYLLLLIAGAVCFLLAALGRRAPLATYVVHLIAFGLFFWILVAVIREAQALH